MIKDLVSIGVAAAMLGVCINTMRLWHHSKALVPCFITLGGHRRYDLALLTQMRSVETISIERRTVAYARVSTHDQKQDLVTQKPRLDQECRLRGWQDFDVISDLGSGMNYSKKGLKKLIGLICDRRIERLVLVSQDRLLRFGAEIVFALCKVFDTEIVIIEPATDNAKESLVQDVLSILTVFSARSNGMKSHRNKKALAGLKT